MQVIYECMQNVHKGQITLKEKSKYKWFTTRFYGGDTRSASKFLMRCADCTPCSMFANVQFCLRMLHRDRPVHIPTLMSEATAGT